MLVCQAMENSVDTVMILYNFISPGLGDRALMYLDVMGLMEYTGTLNGQYQIALLHSKAHVHFFFVS